MTFFSLFIEQLYEERPFVLDSKDHAAVIRYFTLIWPQI